MFDLMDFLLVSLLDLTYQALLSIYLFDQLVLEVDHATLQLLEFEAILTLDLLLGNIKHLSEIAFQHLNILPLLSDHSLETVFTCTQSLL